MTIEALQELIGPRGSASFNSAHRDAVKAWLKGEGCPGAVVNNATLAELNDAYNDTSNTILESWKVGVHRHAVPTPAPAPAPVPSVGGLGVFEAAIAAVVHGIVDSKLTAFTPPTVDEDKVVAIAEDVVKPLRGKLASVDTLLDALGKTGAAASRIPVVAAVASGNRIMEQIAPYYVPGKDCGTNVMLVSPPSFGKSHTIRALGTSYDAYHEHGCTDDIDEVATLLGNPCPDGAGGFTVFDGVLTECVRQAASGKTVLLLLDEVLRLGSRPQEFLLTFLTGVKTAAGRVYRLRTRRVNSGHLEVIECPAANLHIIAASNLGLHRPVEAFWSRWRVTRIEWELATAKSIAKAILDAYGITGDVDKYAAKFATIIGESRKAVKTGLAAFPVDFRILERGAATAPSDDVRDVAKVINEAIPDQVALWDGDTGDVVADSVQLAQSWCKTLSM